MDVLGIEVINLYYLFNYKNAEIIGVFDDIDEAISQYVIKRNDLYSLRLYDDISYLSLIYYKKGDLNVLY